ncbi:MAG: hypothetical protein M1825_002419 [Sarcosagium campestre]|nr:MAG: hypothetical protein M1825_002419 [Sarcosagium campestre]
MSPTPVSPTSSDSAEEQYRSDVGRLKPDGGRLGHRSPGFEDRGEGSNVMRIDSLLGNTRDSGPGLGDPPRSFPVDQPSTLDVLPGEDAGPRCSYTDSCTTGSPLRKVVSHIFGRNKLCTRQIPMGVWVHYCRKHYQRSRYRNPKGFALLQCDLVRKQVDRLQLWGGVKDWIVKVRKREEMRLNKENAQLAAGRDAVGGISAEPDDLGDQGDGGMTDQPATAAGSSRWLVSSTGPGKSARQVLDILDRIEHEIAATGSPFPDVEILPNVVTEKTRQPSRLEGPRGAMTLDASLTATTHAAARGEEMFDSVGRSYGSTHDRAEGIDPQRKRKASSGSSQHGASVVDQHSLEQPDPKRRSRTLQRGLNVEPRRGGAAGFQQSRRDLGLEDESDAGLELGSPQHRRLPSLAMEGAEASRVHSLQNRMAELETGALGETPMHDGTSRRLGRERSHSPPSYEGQNYPASRQEHAEAGQPSTRRNLNPPYSSDPHRFHPLR